MENDIQHMMARHRESTIPMVARLPSSIVDESNYTIGDRVGNYTRIADAYDTYSRFCVVYRHIPAVHPDNPGVDWTQANPII
jgi:hypothetical protein